MLLAIDPLIAAGVALATAATDAVYVMFTSAVVVRRRVPAASWSRLVSAFVFRGDPLHRELGLRGLRGRRFLDWGVRHHRLHASPGRRAPNRCRTRVMPDPALLAREDERDMRVGAAPGMRTKS
jgi:hypothetical protein